MYQAQGRYFLLLDVPASSETPEGCSRCFPLKPEWYNEQSLRQASEAERGAPLPDELREALASLKNAKTLAVRWRDPVSGLGIRSTLTARSTSKPTQIDSQGRTLVSTSHSIATVDPAYEGTQKCHFPFEFQPVIDNKHLSDRDDEQQFATINASKLYQVEARGGADPAPAVRP